LNATPVPHSDSNGYVSRAHGVQQDARNVTIHRKQVMITHDYRNTGGLETAELGASEVPQSTATNSPTFCSMPHSTRAVRDAVAVLAPVGHETVHGAKESLEVVIEECRAGDAVDVVVAVHEHRAARARGRVHHGDRFPHVVEKKGIVGVRRDRVQECCTAAGSLIERDARSRAPADGMRESRSNASSAAASD
jgi:hypothetical protein